MITLDTTRADHLGCYGYGKAQTPNLDALAREGAMAEQAVAVAPLTLPSHASILTSLYPPRHGVRDNADFRLPADALTLAEHLKRLGYGTAAVVGSIVLDSRLGLAQGFDTYDEPRKRSVPQAGSGAGVVYEQLLERPAVGVTDAALAALGRLAGRPFFLWTHYYDPHADYTPPEPYSSRFAGIPYDGEIAYVDAQIGRLLSDLRRRRLLERTLVVIVADHGESLGEHGEATHGLLLYEATLHVPLIVRFAGVVAPATRFPRPVSGVDIAPTALELMSLPPMSGAQGFSFAPELRGNAASHQSTVYSEALFPERAYGWSPLFALRSGLVKFISAPEPELYDLQTDPGEVHNLAAGRHEEIEAWKGTLEATMRRFGPSGPAASRPMDAEERERLSSLGYISGGSSLPQSPHSQGASPAAPGSSATAGTGLRSDPKRLVAVHEAMVEASALVAGGRLQEARTRVVSVLARDPSNPAALSLAGTLDFTTGARDSGLERLRAAALAAPAVYENQRNLANALHVAGHLEEAARAYRAALAIRPGSAGDHYALGNVLFARRETGPAIAEYEEAIRLGSGSAGVHAALGVALASRGQAAAAAASLRKAVAIAPALSGAWSALGSISEKNGQWVDACRSYGRAMSAGTGPAETRLHHAFSCRQAGDRSQAERLARDFLSRYPAHSGAPYLRAILSLDAGDRSAARRGFEEFLAQPGIDPLLADAAREQVARLRATR